MNTRRLGVPAPARRTHHLPGLAGGGHCRTGSAPDPAAGGGGSGPGHLPYINFRREVPSPPAWRSTTRWRFAPCDVATTRCGHGRVDGAVPAQLRAPAVCRCRTPDHDAPAVGGITGGAGSTLIQAEQFDVHQEADGRLIAEQTGRRSIEMDLTATGGSPPTRRRNTASSTTSCSEPGRDRK